VYDHPRSAFVYEFLGAANQLQGQVGEHGFTATDAVSAVGVQADFRGPALAFVRPHDLQLVPGEHNAAHAGGIRVGIRRVIPVGGTVRVELETGAGRILEAELDRASWQALGIAVGDGVTAVPRALQAFPAQAQARA
jgi:sulfate transport system ATP-binding protein